MKNDDMMKQLKEEYEKIPVPEEGIAKMQKAIEQAKKDKARQAGPEKKIVPFKRLKRTAAGAAAALALCVILPNTSENIAMAMEKIPFLGDFVRVVTFDRYDFDSDNYNANVEIPKLEPENSSASEAAGQINKSVQEYTDQLVSRFKQEVEKDGEGHEGLDISYQVITDNENWFTLKLTTLETQASGYQQYHFYHIDKSTGNVAGLKDLFRDGYDYISVISENIKSQMRSQMAEDENKSYFLDSDMPVNNFKEIASDQNFYYNEAGDLVIVFNEYDVAPGYMGTPEFVIPNEVWKAGSK